MMFQVDKTIALNIMLSLVICVHVVQMYSDDINSLYGLYDYFVNLDCDLEGICDCYEKATIKEAICSSRGIHLIPRQLVDFNILDFENNSFTFTSEDFLKGWNQLMEATASVIHFMYLRSNPLTVMNQQFLEKLCFVIYLDLGNCQLSELDETVFIFQTKIKTLLLDKNNMTTLPKDLFRKQKNLRYLNLSFNKLKNLNENVFRAQVNLIELFLDGNTMDYLPAGIFRNLKTLTLLGLSENKLTSLPQGLFASLINLKYLKIYSNYLTEFREGIFDDKNTGNFVLLSTHNNPFICGCGLLGLYKILNTFEGINITLGNCIYPKTNETALISSLEFTVCEETTQMLTNSVETTEQVSVNSLVNIHVNPDEVTQHVHLINGGVTQSTLVKPNAVTQKAPVNVRDVSNLPMSLDNLTLQTSVRAGEVSQKITVNSDIMPLLLMKYDETTQHVPANSGGISKHLLEKRNQMFANADQEPVNSYKLTEVYDIVQMYSNDDIQTDSLNTNQIPNKMTTNSDLESFSTSQPQNRDNHITNSTNNQTTGHNDETISTEGIVATGTLMTVGLAASIFSVFSLTKKLLINPPIPSNIMSDQLQSV